MVIEFYESRALDLLADPRAAAVDDRLGWWYMLLTNAVARQAADTVVMVQRAAGDAMFIERHHDDAWRQAYVFPLIAYLRGAYGAPPPVRSNWRAAYDAWNRGSREGM